MKKFIVILFFSCAIILCLGFWKLDTEDVALGHKLIGTACLLGMFILIPCFIYYRWKGKNVRDYMLTDEAFKRMKEFNKDKEKNKRNPNNSK
ncbi:MAG: hypothetical protein CL818_07715 [Croceibacter sp.]|jgi:amino acid permease|uniref:hypothetical protein n=1 Tax=Croceibacter TaxID=216431 RepID=UPI000C35B07D|nr:MULTISPECIES: hypothetical protein [Croceibacter]MBG25940.1 hypothetical protein [Croceibacter sp.]|tara:strand:+ start:2233 stop:2508 length:276 start_codon:yes stop_codon:yes gene_type:complete